MLARGGTGDKKKRRRENQRDKPVADGPCGSRPRRSPAVLPPAARSIRSGSAIQELSSTGRHPPLGGGRMLARAPCSECRSDILPPASPSTKFPEEPEKRPPRISGAFLRHDGLRRSGTARPTHPCTRGIVRFSPDNSIGENGVSFMRGRMGGERGKTSWFFVFSKEVAGGGISSGFPGHHGRGAGMVDGRGVRGGRGIFRCPRGSRWGGRCGGGCGGGSICSGRR